MGAFREAQQAAERGRCRYLYPGNGLKQLTSVVELGKLKEAEEKDDSVGEPAVSTNLDP